MVNSHKKGETQAKQEPQLANGLSVGGVHLYRKRLHDGMNRDHGAQLTFAPHHDSLKPLERACRQADAPALDQIRTRLRHLQGDGGLDRLDLLFRHTRQLSVEANQTHYPRNCEYTQARTEEDAHKDISREKRQLDQCRSVIPAAEALEEGQIGFDGLGIQLLMDQLFVTRARVDRIPFRFFDCCAAWSTKWSFENLRANRVASHFRFPGFGLTRVRLIRADTAPPPHYISCSPALAMWLSSPATRASRWFAYAVPAKFPGRTCT